MRRLIALVLGFIVITPMQPAVALPAGAAAAAIAPGAVDWSLDARTVKTNCAARLAEANTQTDAVAKMPVSSASFASVVAALEDITADLSDSLVAEQLLGYVSSDRAIRAASFACSQDIGNFGAALQTRGDLYRLVQAAGKDRAMKSAADRKLYEYTISAFRRSGATLPDEQRASALALVKKLNALSNDYSMNLANDATTFTLSAAQAAALSPDFVATFKKSAGSYVVPANESTYERFMQEQPDSAVRKRFYVAFLNRAYPKNSEVLKEAVAARAQLARLYGYPTWSDYILADRMAGTPQRVRSFLDGLAAKLKTKAQAELTELTSIAGGHIESWDYLYTENRLLQSKYALDDNAVRQYFQVDRVVPGVLSIYSRLLGVTYTPVANPRVWAAGVQQYSVVDTATGRFMGTFYLDLYPRSGKYTHFANFDFLPARVLADGSRRPPVSAIIGNWPQPAPGKPALLSHDEVRTFFHEFGHCMASILTLAPYETLSSGFRWDFVEAPSQMLENWVFDPGILKEISSDARTGRPMPDELIAKIIANRHRGDGIFYERQVAYAMTDIDMHTNPDVPDISELFARNMAKYTPFTYPPGVHFDASFEHLMNGYDSGYYGYLWSLVYAQDMFTVFQSGGLENPAVGSRYRDDILVPARIVEPEAEVTKFLGRPMRPDAFYASIGITAP